MRKVSKRETADIKKYLRPRMRVSEVLELLSMPSKHPLDDYLGEVFMS